MVATVLSTFASAQIRSSASVSKLRQSGYVIPNPDDKLSLATLLSHQSVRTAVQLDDESEKRLLEFLRLNGNSFKTIPMSFTGESAPPIAEYRDAQSEHRKKSELFLDEILSSKQWQLLKQAAYQVEVGRIGLGPAITAGRLGEDIGIHEQQREQVERKAKEIQSRVDEVRPIVQPRLPAGIISQQMSLRANGPTDLAKLPGLQPYQRHSPRPQPCRLG